MGKAVLPRSSSQASQLSDAASTSTSGGDEKASRPTEGGDLLQRDVLDTAPPLQTAVFELLHVVQRERIDSNYVVAFLKLALDFLQLQLLLLQPQFRWNIDRSLWLWKAFNWVGYFPSQIILKSYAFYTGTVTFVAAVVLGMLLAFIVLLEVWMIVFLRQRSIKWARVAFVLRVYMLVIIQTFFVAGTSLMLVGLNCRLAGAVPIGQAHGTLAAYPTHSCGKAPQVAYLVLSALVCLVWFLLHLGCSLTEGERNPASRRILASYGVACEVHALVTKAVIVVVAGTCHGYKKPQGVVLAAAAFYLMWIYFKRMPHYNQWVNHARVGLYSMLALTGGMQVAMMWNRDLGFAASQTSWLWIWLGPTAAATFLLSMLRHWTLRRIHTHAFRELRPKEKAKVYRFSDVAEVEIATRVMRCWPNKETALLDVEAVKEAEAIIKVGLSQFHTSAAMTLMSSNFLISVANVYHAGFTQTQAAKKQSPSIVDIFTIFLREQEHLHASAAQKGAGGAMDLVSYVEFQRSHRRALQSHRAALLAIRLYWRTVLHPVVSFRKLSKMVDQMGVARAVADKTYKSVMEVYPTSSKLMRGYAHFLEDVHNDPWAATRFYRQADKLDADAQAAESSLFQLAGAGEDGAAVDEKNTAILFFTAAGGIQMVSKVTAALFGWRKSDLEGKNVAVILPPPYNLVTYIRSCLEEKKPLRPVEMVGQHLAKHVFGLHLHVSKVSGSGDAAMFMAIIKPDPSPPGVVKVWVLLSGAVCHVDALFQDTFGSSAQERIGQPLAAMAVDSTVLAGLVTAALECLANIDVDEGQVLASALSVRLLHAFRDPVEVDVTVTAGGPESTPVLVFSFLRKEPADLLMVSNHRGAITFMTADLASLLGHSAPALIAAHTTVSSLLPQPWAQLMFPQWLREALLSAGHTGGAGGQGGGGADFGGVGGGGAAAATSGARGTHLVQLVTADKQFVTARLHVAAVAGREGDPALVITVHKTSVEAGLDMRRLTVQVDSRGVVLTASACPQWLFGFVPSTLVGSSMRSFLDVLRHSVANRPTSATGASAASRSPRNAATLLDSHGSLHASAFFGPETPVGESSAFGQDAAPNVEQVVVRLAELSLDDPGASWRVGVHPPIAESAISNTSALAQGMLARQTRPARMQVSVADVSEGADGVDGTLTSAVALTLHLWRADAVCGVLEVDSHTGLVNHLVDQVVNPAGLIWGKAQQAIVGRPLDSLLETSALVGGFAKLLCLDNGSRKVMGAAGARAPPPPSGGAVRVGPVRHLAGPHADGGNTMQLSVQAVGKRGNSAAVLLVLRLIKPQCGDSAAFLSSLFAQLHHQSEELCSQSLLAATPSGVFARNASRTGLLAGPATQLSGMSSIQKRDAFALALAAESKIPGTVMGFESLCAAAEPVVEVVLDEAGDAAGAVPYVSGRQARRLSLLSASLVSNASDMVVQINYLGGSSASPGGDGNKQHSAGLSGKLRAPRSLAAPAVSPTNNGDQEREEEVECEVQHPRSSSDAGSDSMSHPSEGEATIDFQRGKRYQKLCRLVGTGAAQVSLRFYKWHTLSAWTLILVVSTACFVGLTVAINQQISFIDTMMFAAYGGKAMVGIAIASRAISNIHAGIANVLYSKAYLPAIANLLSQALVLFREVHTGIYMGFSGKQTHLPSAYNLSDTWTKPWRQVKVMYDTVPPSYGIVMEGLWVEGNNYIAAGDELLQQHNKWAAAGLNISSRPEFYFIVNNGPPDIYEAYKTTIDGFSLRAADSTNQVNRLQIIFLIVQGCIVCLLTTVRVSWLLHRVAEQRYGLFSVFLTVPHSCVRALATKKVRLDGDSEDDSDADVYVEPGDSLGLPAILGDSLLNASASNIVVDMAEAGHGAPAAAPAKKRWPEVWAGLVCYACFWRPLLVAGGRKRLLRDGRDTYWLIAPFVLWTVAIIVMYAASYSILGNMLEPIQGLNLLNSVRTRVVRIYFWAHEAASIAATDPVGYQSVMAQMAADVVALRVRVPALLYGVTYMPSLATDPLYNKMKHGIPTRSQAAADIFFKEGQCLMVPASACQGVKSPYYAVSQSGLDAMLQRYILEAGNMLQDDISVVNLNSTRLSYITALGPNDIYQALLDEALLAQTNVVGYYKSAKSVQLAVFIIAWFYAAGYLLFFMRTLVSGVRQEARQVAHLLSQLPREVDVEALVHKSQQRTHGGAHSHRK